MKGQEIKAKLLQELSNSKNNEIVKSLIESALRPESNGRYTLRDVFSEIKGSDRDAVYTMLKCLSELYKEKSLLPEYFDYEDGITSLISFNNFAGIKKIYDDYFKSSFNPCERALNKALGALIDSENDAYTLDLIVTAYQQNHKMDLNNLLKKLILLQKDHLINEIIKLLSVHLPETLYLWNIYIEHCCSKGNLECISNLLADAQNKYYMSHGEFVENLYNKYIHELLKTKNKLAVTELMNQVLKSKIPLSPESLRLLIRLGLDTTELFETVLNIIKEYYEKIDITTASLIFKIMIRNNKRTEVLELLDLSGATKKGGFGFKDLKLSGAQYKYIICLMQEKIDSITSEKSELSEYTDSFSNMDKSDCMDEFDLI